MSETSREARALERMVDELRAEQAPELAWDDIERKLLAAVDKADRAKAVRAAARPSPLFQAFTFAAAAAAIALGIGTMGGGSPTPAPTEDPTEAAIEIDGRGMPMLASGDLMIEVLRVGDVIDTTEEPIAFALPGSVRWVLAPQSRAVVRAVANRSGIGHVVALERGLLRAEVTPRAPSEGLVEAFAVEVEHTRIAVHGTAFSVGRVADGVVVDVEHGSIAVGPVGHIGATTGHLLIGPSRALFSLDGGRSAHFLPPLAPPSIAAIAPPVVAPAPEPNAPSDAPIPAVRPGGLPQKVVPVNPPMIDAPPVAPAPAAPAVPIAAPLLTNESIRAKLAACYEKAYEPGSSSVKVSVSSKLRLKLSTDGQVQAMQFTPPLKPEFQECAAGLYSGRFADGSVGEVVIPLSF